MAILQEIKAAVATLTPAEQLELMDFLESAANGSHELIRSEWSGLAAKRLAEHETGIRKAVPFDTVFKRLKIN